MNAATDSLFLHACILVDVRFLTASLQISRCCLRCESVWLFSTSCHMINQCWRKIPLRSLIGEISTRLSRNLCTVCMNEDNLDHAPHQRTPTIWHCQIFLVAFSDWCDSHTTTNPPTKSGSCNVRKQYYSVHQCLSNRSWFSPRLFLCIQYQPTVLNSIIIYIR
jgi:hypothetical protein